MIAIELKAGEMSVRKELAQLDIAIWASLSLLIAQPLWGGGIEGHVSRGNAQAVADVVVFVDDVEGPFPAPTEPSAMREMNQKGLSFVPHVLAILAGSTVEFPNSDPVFHNVFSISETKRFNLGLYGQGVKRNVRFDQPGVVELLCSVHMEMSGYIVVLKNPYFAVTGTDGDFRIVGVPAGRHRLRCWHEKLPEQEGEIDVPSEGLVTVNFDMSSKKNSRQRRETSGG